MKRVLAFILLEGFSPAFLAASVYAPSVLDAILTAFGVAIVYGAVLHTLNAIVGMYHCHKKERVSNTMKLMKRECPECGSEVSSDLACECGARYKVANDGLVRRIK